MFYVPLLLVASELVPRVSSSFHWLTCTDEYCDSLFRRHATKVWLLCCISLLYHLFKWVCKHHHCIVHLFSKSQHGWSCSPDLLAPHSNHAASRYLADSAKYKMPHVSAMCHTYTSVCPSPCFKAWTLLEVPF
jgi:hypothetical protein